MKPGRVYRHHKMRDVDFYCVSVSQKQDGNCDKASGYWVLRSSWLVLGPKIDTIPLVLADWTEMADVREDKSKLQKGFKGDT